MALSKLCTLAVCRTMSTSLIAFSDFLSSPKAYHQAFFFPRLKFDAFDLSGLKTMLPTTESYFSYLFLHILFSLYSHKKISRTDIKQ